MGIALAHDYQLMQEYSQKNERGQRLKIYSRLLNRQHRTKRTIQGKERSHQKYRFTLVGIITM